MRRNFQPHEGLPSKLSYRPTARTWRDHRERSGARDVPHLPEIDGDLAKRGEEGTHGPKFKKWADIATAAMGGHDPSCRKMLQTGCQSSKSTLQLQVQYIQTSGKYKCRRCREDRQSPQHSLQEPWRLSGWCQDEDCREEDSWKDCRENCHETVEDGGYWSNLWIKDLRVCKQNLDSLLYSLIVVALRW
jgi:hypothetical protein